MIRVRFDCGHEVEVNEQVNAFPVCAVCGAIRITRVDPRRLPRFVGTCQGPLAEERPMTPGTVNVAPAGPLRLKES